MPKNIGEFLLWDAPAGNQSSSIRNIGLDICFDEYNSRNSLLSRLIKGMGHCFSDYVF